MLTLGLYLLVMRDHHAATSDLCVANSCSRLPQSTSVAGVWLSRAPPEDALEQLKRNLQRVGACKSSCSHPRPEVMPKRRTSHHAPGPRRSLPVRSWSVVVAGAGVAVSGIDDGNKTWSVAARAAGERGSHSRIHIPNSAVTCRWYRTLNRSRPFASLPQLVLLLHTRPGWVRARARATQASRASQARPSTDSHWSLRAIDLHSPRLRVIIVDSIYYRQNARPLSSAVTHPQH